MASRGKFYSNLAKRCTRRATHARKEADLATNAAIKYHWELEASRHSYNALKYRKIAKVTNHQTGK